MRVSTTADESTLARSRRLPAQQRWRHLADIENDRTLSTLERAHATRVFLEEYLHLTCGRRTDTKGLMWDGQLGECAARVAEEAVVEARDRATREIARGLVAAEGC
jgi:hypothetical protein